MRSGATLSACGKYRYDLWREWDASGSVAVFIMLNPSTADALKDDPTIRKCMALARLWGCGAIRVVNLFAFRATDPRHLPAGEIAESEPGDPGRNVRTINNAAFGEFPAPPDNPGLGLRFVYARVCAWGADKRVGMAGDVVASYLRRKGYEIHRLGDLTKGGYPRHPLYLPNRVKVERW